MATQLQLRRGTTSENGSFTGALGEVTVDTDKDTLVVHDGATAGGHELAKTSDLTAKAATDGSNMTAIDVGDSVKLKMGASDDLQIFHDGNNSFINEVGTGNLSIKSSNNLYLLSGSSELYAAFTADGASTLYHNNAAKIATTSSGVDVTGGITASGNIDVGDNVQLKMGTGDDLKIYHDGSDSIIEDVGSGNLQIRADDFYLMKGATEVMIRADTDGAVKLYHDNSQKIETTSTGVNVTGSLSFSVGSLNVANGDLNIDGDTGIRFQADSLMPRKNGSDADNAVDLGLSSHRYKNAHLSGTVNAGTLSLNQTAVQDIATTVLKNAYATGSNHATAVQFRNAANSEVGTIKNTATATAYNTSSDYRLKEDVQAMSGATDRLKELKPVNFAWKVDGSRVDGFLAHEAQEVVPESVSGSKDAMKTEKYEVSPATGDIYTPEVVAVEGVEAVEYVAPQDEVLDEDGNVVTEAVAEVMAVEAVEAVEGVAEVIHSADTEQPSELEEGQLWRETTAQVMGEREVPNYQGIDQSKLVPLLVATIQELEARITALEA